MKKVFIVCAALAAMVSVARAGNDFDCRTVGDLAEIVMDRRQSGVVSMSEMIGAIRSTDNMGIPATTNLSEIMVQRAFEMPRFSSEEYRRRAIMDFRNEFELVCYKTQTKKDW